MKLPVRFAAVVVAALFVASILGCSAQPGSLSATAMPAPDSILVNSIPAPGVTISAINNLELRFKPPARLDEVTLRGPDGVMPMMVHAIGEVQNYSIPLPELGPGSYTVNWRASAQGQVHRGSFEFTVK